MILDKTLEVCWNRYVNKDHYEELGYKFTKNYDRFVVKIEEVHSSCSTKVNVRCDECNGYNKKVYRALLHTPAYKKFGFGSYFCNECMFQKREKPTKNTVVRQIKYHFNYQKKIDDSQIPEEHLRINLAIEQHNLIIPEVCGIYKFFDTHNNLLYIGQAKNLKVRISQHISGSSNTSEYSHLFKFVSCSYVDERQSLDDLEVYLINELKPKYNKALVYTYRSG